MQVRLIPVAAASEPADLKGTTAVVFDVLRATSTIATALASGYRQVYPVAEAAEALALTCRYGFVLAGERGGEKIDGFPHGNSPLEFSNGPKAGKRLTEVDARLNLDSRAFDICAGPHPGEAAGKSKLANKAGSDVLVLTTSNGTQAIHRAADAAKVLTGSLLNARAAAQFALREKRDISLVCAGTAGCFSLEDTLGAGFVLVEIIRLLGKTIDKRHAASVDMDDLAAAAYGLARYYYNDPLSGLRTGRHGQKLLRLGREEDLRWCAQLNRFDIAPVFTGEYITVGSANDY